MQEKPRGAKRGKGMKRVVLIAGGTVGGLGAVMSITPPQLSDNGLSTLAGASAATSITPSSITPVQESPAQVTPEVQESVAAVATKKSVATKKATTTVKKSVAQTQKSTATTAPKPTSTPTPTPTPTSTKAATTQKSLANTNVTGQFTGDAIDVGYGIMQVKIIVSNGKITDAEVVQAPFGRSQRWTDYAVPNLRSQTLSAQSAAINGVSGASYTSYGWYKSLITALQKAGMSPGV